MKLTILYRGDLASCNYACPYCPFAKRKDTRRQLAGDRSSLRRFLDWVAETRRHELGILFTPWGEALIRRWYQGALVELTHQSHVWKAAIQTNLSGSLSWIEDCKLEKLALWTTFHPTQVALNKFAAKVIRLHERGVRLSVGAVGKLDHLASIEELRRRIPREIYVWVNTYKGPGQRDDSADVKRLAAIDPLYSLDRRRHRSRGEACRTGQSVFTVDGSGAIRRCHFVDEVIGNIHTPNWEVALQQRPCPRGTCQCFLGYAHLERLNLQQVFGEHLLERIPVGQTFMPDGEIADRNVCPTDRITSA